MKVKGKKGRVQEETRRAGRNRQASEFLILVVGNEVAGGPGRAKDLFLHPLHSPGAFRWALTEMGSSRAMCETWQV